MFEKASKLKLRFNFKGNISTEDLWDLSLTDLDEIYKSLSKNKKENSGEDSLIGKPTKESKITDLKIDIVKHIFAVKTAEKDAREQRAAKLVRKRQLQDIIARKQDEELQNKSTEELAKLLDELDSDESASL